MHIFKIPCGCNNLSYTYVTDSLQTLNFQMQLTMKERKQFMRDKNHTPVTFAKKLLQIKVTWKGILQESMRKKRLSNVTFVISALHTKIHLRNILHLFMREKNCTHARYVTQFLLLTISWSGILQQSMRKRNRSNVKYAMMPVLQKRLF